MLKRFHRIHVHTKHRRAISLLEVLVVAGVMILLMAMLLPSLSRARELARRVQCSNNLRQWGVASYMYREDNDNFLPTEGTYLHPGKPYTWFNVLPPYLGAPAYREVEGVGNSIRDFPELDVWICPSKNRSRLFKSDSGKNQFHYGMNQVLDGISSLAPDFPDQGEEPILASRFLSKPKTVFMFDIYRNVSAGTQADVATLFHGDYANVLRLDGSVAGFGPDKFVENGDFRRPIPIWYHPELYWGYLPKKR